MRGAGTILANDDLDQATGTGDSPSSADLTDAGSVHPTPADSRTSVQGRPPFSGEQERVADYEPSAIPRQQLYGLQPPFSSRAPLDPEAAEQPLPSRTPGADPDARLGPHGSWNAFGQAGASRPGTEPGPPPARVPADPRERAGTPLRDPAGQVGHEDAGAQSPSDSYDMPDSNGAAASYGPAASYAPADPYGPADTYGSADPYGPPEAYGQADPYGPDTYSPADAYGPPDAYGQPDAYIPADTYRPADARGAANGFTQAAPNPPAAPQAPAEDQPPADSRTSRDAGFAN